MTTYQLYLMVLGGLSDSATNEDRETARIYLSELYKRIEKNAQNYDEFYEEYLAEVNKTIVENRIKRAKEKKMKIVYSSC